MNTQDDGSQEGQVYVLRLQERAIRDITAAFVRLAELVSLKVADEWRDGLRNTIAGLATNPRRFPLAPEAFKREVRHLLFQRKGSKATYRVFFTITAEQEPSSDPPTVTILHVRHAASRPITRRQAQQIESLE